ncbi:MAG: GIY-YIG nuclease family protein [Patescibacteria group bacterium]
MQDYYVYILASKRNGTLYIGVTNNLVKRIFEHKQKSAKSFTKKYNINLLVYYEVSKNIESAIQREKNMKRWNREWKIDLIEMSNPEWKDSYQELL